jgi:hypothetical protein
MKNYSTSSTMTLLSSPLSPSGTTDIRTIDSPTLLKKYTSSSILPLSSPLSPSGSTDMHTIDSPTLLKKYTSSSMLPLSSPLFSSDTTATPTATASATPTDTATHIHIHIPIATATATATATPIANPSTPIATPSTPSTPIATFDSPALQRRKRSVHFLPMVAVRKTISRQSMTQQEKCNCWLQAHEFLMIKQRNYMVIMKQLHQLGQCIFNDTNDSVHDVCLRGLEWGMESESLRKKTFRLGALEEVFIEQEAQYLGDYYDDEAIAYAYYSVSNECQLLAERIALQDRKEIEDYIFDDYETF